MAQSIKNLPLGSTVSDSKGNKFEIISKDHYKAGEITLLHQDYSTTHVITPTTALTSNFSYGASEIQYYLDHTYPEVLDAKLRESVVVTQVPYKDVTSAFYRENRLLSTKFFIPSVTELGQSSIYEEDINLKPFGKLNFVKFGARVVWTRTEAHYSSNGSSLSYFYTSALDSQGINAVSLVSPKGLNQITPIFNVPSSLLVSDTPSSGVYSLIFDTPPTIQTIPHLSGSYGSGVTIQYTARDSEGLIPVHQLSTDNGQTWRTIKPTQSGDKYVYTHVFGGLGNYSCRIRVTDTAGNTTTSNMFVVNISSSHPTVNIVSVIDKVITFKASCTTDDVSKVEVLINGVVRETFTNGFEFNLIHEIDRNYLTSETNTIQLRATSSANLVTIQSMQATKITYALPPIGSKIFVDEVEYTIESTIQDGSNQVYTLDKNLLSSVAVNQAIQVMQDKVTVKCCLANVNNSTEYKDMKLTKIKRLKGDFAGYVEEKYELGAEGRYSNIKIELERFNSDVESEIIELQQHFDYIED